MGRVIRGKFARAGAFVPLGTDSTRVPQMVNIYRKSIEYI